MNVSIDFSRLRKSPMLKDLLSIQWDEFMEYALRSSRSYNKGQIIYLEGDSCESADFIAGGSLHVKRHDIEGRTFMIERFTTGDMIGANLLFSSDAVYPMTIIAESDCTIISIEKRQILDWCQGSTAFLESYLNEISDKTKVLVRAVKKISTGTLRENLMVYFEELTESQLGTDEVGDKAVKRIRLPITKKELAERYGVARTSLSRELKRMEDDGIIGIIDSKTLEILSE